MLRLTSKITKNNDGRGVTRQAYEEKRIPAFKEARVEWNRTNHLITDERNNRGFVFSGSMNTNKKVLFDIIVMRELGSLRVICIRRK